MWHSSKSLKHFFHIFTRQIGYGPQYLLCRGVVHEQRYFCHSPCNANAIHECKGFRVVSITVHTRTCWNRCVVLLLSRPSSLSFSILQPWFELPGWLHPARVKHLDFVWFFVAFQPRTHWVHPTDRLHPSSCHALPAHFELHYPCPCFCSHRGWEQQKIQPCCSIHYPLLKPCVD